MPNEATDSATRFSDFSRDRFIPLIDANAIRRLVGMDTIDEGHAWARVDKSEVFDFAFNPQENTKGYIDTANDSTFVEKYQPQMDQEIIVDGNNEVYSLMYEYSMHFPTGSDAEIPCAVIMPSVKDDSVADAFLWEQAILSPSNINTIDKKLTFSMKFNGEMKRGTGAKNAETGRFEIAFDDEDKGGEVETLSAKSTKASAFKAESDK